ncbi:MAG TPA: ribosome biogenesis GTPase Der, partial [Candidatus Limnocylindrales bacterium]|nr:ribosome biogenesis GTPase Der [Candidatus Limnocylindrales bacterium]
ELERKRVEAQLDAEQGTELPLEMPEEAAFAMDDRPARIAINGRPNVRKSSLLHALLGRERAIVSDIPGTTRDAIDTSVEWAGRTVRLIDTAGIRRRGKVASGPAAERYATLRAMKAVSRADVAVLVLDAQDGMTTQDEHVAGYALEEGAGLVIAINKWDVVEKDEDTFDEYVSEIRQKAPFIDLAPIVTISAKSGLRVGRVLEAAVEIASERRRRIPTSALNSWLREATFRRPAPTVRGRQSRFFYATQATIEPPTFILFANGAAAIHFSYRRYLENRLREAFGFAGTPIRLIIRERSRDDREPRPVRRKSGSGTKGGKGSKGSKAVASGKSGKTTKPVSKTKAAKPRGGTSTRPS